MFPKWPLWRVFLTVAAGNAVLCGVMFWLIGLGPSMITTAGQPIGWRTYLTMLAAIGALVATLLTLLEWTERKNRPANERRWRLGLAQERLFKELVAREEKAARISRDDPAVAAALAEYRAALTDYRREGK